MPKIGHSVVAVIMWTLTCGWDASMVNADAFCRHWLFGGQKWQEQQWLRSASMERHDRKVGSDPYACVVNLRGGDTRNPEAAVAENDAIEVTVTESMLGETSNQTDTMIPSSFTFSIYQPGDGSETDPDGLPGRFLRMQKGNREKAKAAFHATLKWRKKYSVDTILERPHTKLDACKAVLPHYFCGRDPTGHVIFVQRPGLVQMDLAHTNNITTQDLLMHYVYVLEYCWNMIEPRPDQTMTSVIDLHGINFGAIIDMLSFVKQFVGMMSSNYPQRSYKTLLINSPKWFGGIYKLIAPLLRESTKAKIEIHSKGPKQDDVLKTYLGAQAPQELMSDFAGESENGSLSGEAESKSAMEREFRQFCVARLKEAGLDMQKLI